MSAWNRPPAGISVVTFFETWLPAAYVATGRIAPANAPAVRATLSGDGGGTWDIQCDEDALVVEAVASKRPRSEGNAALPDVWLRQSTADFKAAFDGDPHLPTLIPTGWSALDLLFLDPRDADLLSQVSGRVVVEILGRRARRWSFDVAFGKAGVTAGRARTTIRLDGATFEGLQNGTLPPMQALLGGRLTIEGDRALAMQLLLLFGNRLARR
ncbi:MAG: SCP2 sterol-binding domain-containing protein [Deltaproteobacteria bacterium]|nr:SCP2 sterol-binding domain-containing protein [Deltaproteobacteria bacterium]